jgi:hypothetical protein
MAVVCKAAKVRMTSCRAGIACKPKDPNFYVGWVLRTAFFPVRSPLPDFSRASRSCRPARSIAARCSRGRGSTGRSSEAHAEPWLLS